MDIAAWGTMQFEFFILVFFRVLGLMLVAPFYGSASVPANVKILFSLLIAAIVYPMVPKAGIALPGEFVSFAFAAAGEMAIGFIIGFAATLLMTSIQLGGHWVGQQIGLTLANVIDPISNTQLSIIEQFKFIFAILIFMAMNGHHYLLKALVSTFEVIPVRGFSLSTQTCYYVADTMGTEMFVFSIKVAAPFIVALLMATVAMGFIAKTVPEINIFIIGFGVRVVIGFGLLFLVLPALAALFEKIFFRMAVDVDNLIKLMAA
jgi:flagellar biosynthetic protein FliR